MLRLKAAAFYHGTGYSYMKPLLPRWLAALMLCGAASPAQPGGTPPCNADNRGAVRREGGEVVICTAGAWKYQWRPATVHVSRLAAKPAQNRPPDGRGSVTH